MITDHERRMLDEIELHLRMDDPRFAARLTTVRAERIRLRLRASRTRLSIVGALVGMVWIVVFFATAPLVALVGVALLGTATGVSVAPISAAIARTARRIVQGTTVAGS